MNLTLYYRGSLASNGSPTQKQAIRRVFHEQLRTIWSRPPLDRVGLFLTHDPDEGLLIARGEFEFAPLVASDHNASVTIHVQMLRQGPPGGVVGSTGDIDNQMKTLLDALSVPSLAQIPTGDKPKSNSEKPLFCLLEDDRLITDLRISVAELLVATPKKNEVVLLIGFESRARYRDRIAASYLHG